MTIIEAIAKFDKLKPNGIEQTDKIEWLSTCDWNIYRDIIETHEDADKVTFKGYDESTPLDTVLIAPAPYDEMYVYWLEAQSDYNNGEIGRYNNSISMFNSVLESFRNNYNSKHKPLQKNKMKYF